MFAPPRPTGSLPHPDSPCSKVPSRILPKSGEACTNRGGNETACSYAQPSGQSEDVAESGGAPENSGNRCMRPCSYASLRPRGRIVSPQLRGPCPGPHVTRHEKAHVTRRAALARAFASLTAGGPGCGCAYASRILPRSLRLRRAVRRCNPPDGRLAPRPHGYASRPCVAGLAAMPPAP
jgi:hypothetical protein